MYNSRAVRFVQEYECDCQNHLVEETDIIYLKSIQTGTDNPAVFYKHCSICGKVNQETFEWNCYDGVNPQHLYIYGHCIACDDCIYEYTDSQPLTGVFSVSSTKKVKFSPGNLLATYNGEEYAWSFADSQYYTLNSDGNSTIDNQVQGAVVDGFGWSSTGTKFGIHSSLEDSTYRGVFVDWKVLFGKNNEWRSLSKEEFAYLWNSRKNASSKIGNATIDVSENEKRYGVIILPDSFTDPHVNSATNASNNAFVSKNINSNWNANIYTPENWLLMENAGAILFELDGYRYGNKHGSGGIGQYWTSSSTERDFAYAAEYYQEGSSIRTYSVGRHYGLHVRLVKDVK